ncbi:MAG: hypothetical protein ACK5MT_19910 [Actinomycetales bacterium]
MLSSARLRTVVVALLPGLVFGALVTTAAEPAGAASRRPGATTQPLPAPAHTQARADSMGLAVTVEWAPVAGASRYAVYRAPGESDAGSPGSLLATVPATGITFRDDAATAGRTSTYRVAALDSAGVSGQLGPGATVTTTDETLSARSRALAWLRAQQGPGQEFTVTLDQTYPAGHLGPVAGTVSDPARIPHPVREVPWIGFDQPYSQDYQGPVAGSYAHVDDPAAFHVETWSRPPVAGEPEYLQGSYPLAPDGSWNSGTQVMHPGVKTAYLVRSVDGTRVARSGTGARQISGVSVHVVIRTDRDYLVGSTPLSEDGSWQLPWVEVPSSGTLIARLVNEDTGRVVGSSDWPAPSADEGLVRSFRVPFDDSARGTGADGTGYPVERRSWVYDDALAAIAFTSAGDFEPAARVLSRLSQIQNADGSLPFSYDLSHALPADGYVRSGTVAWAGTAALVYEQRTGDSSYRHLAVRSGEYLLAHQVSRANGFSKRDPRYGSVLGGSGSYDENGGYTDAPVSWAATEHNIDAYFLLRDLGYATGDERFSTAAELVKTSLLEHHWNAAEGRFNQGVGDTAESLDLASWGGLFLLAVGERDKAAQSAHWMTRFGVRGQSVAESGYASPGPIDGYQPYLAGYPNPPQLVWAEGTWGAILFSLRSGQDVTADLESMHRLQAADPDGGVVQVTRSAPSVPYEFHVWPSVAGSAWQAIVSTDPGLLWRRDGWIADAPSGA